MSNLLEKASIITTPTAYSDGVLHSVKPEQTLGSELLVNGDFATDSNWNKGTGWSISNNTAISDGSSTSGSLIFQTIELVEGKTYQVIVDVDSVDSGRVRFYSNFLGSGGQADIASSGTFTYNLTSTITAGRTVGIQIRDAGTQSVINSISVKELINADFTFTRNNIGTRVNASGNIESVGVDLPRIDYRGGIGSWLLEPEATNTATDSNDFTTGDIFEGSSNPSLTSAILTSAQATSPDGTNNAWKLADNNNSSSGVTGLKYGGASLVANSYNTVSLFVKKQGDNDFIYIRSLNYGSTSDGHTWFDIANGTLGNVDSNHTASIIDYGNGWYRCSITFQTSTDTIGQIQIYLATSNGNVSITRDGTNGAYIYGLQAESHATREYSTSYIPTSGDPQTRGADICQKAGSSDLISSTEGVFYAELKSIAEYTDSASSISINNSSAQSRFNIYKIASSNKLKVQLRPQNNSAILSYTSTSTNVDFDKVAVKWKSGDYAIWINGVEVATDTSTILPIGLNRINFNGYTTTYQPFQGNIKCVAVFKEALTDAELTALTS